MNKKQVLSFIKQRMAPIDRARFVQQQEELIFEVNDLLKLILTPDPVAPVGIAVELVLKGRQKGDQANKIYFYHLNQLRITEFFVSDEEQENSC